MKNKILPVFAFLALAFSACDKDEENPIKMDKEALTSNNWKFQDVLVVQDISYEFMGVKSDYDTTYSVFQGRPACELDFSVQFLIDNTFDHTEMDTYCGEELLDASDSRWELNESKAEFTIIGPGMAGMVSVAGEAPVSLGDTAVYKVIELSKNIFILDYVMDQDAMMESLGMGDMFEEMEMKVSGDSKVRISLMSE